MTDSTELDEILALPDPNAAPVAVPEPVAETPAPADPSQPRAADGKFAPKASEAPVVPDPTSLTPAADPGKTVPLEALHESREKVRTLETQLAEMRGQISLLSQRPQTPVVPKETPKPKDIWEDPNGFTQDAVSKVVEPLQQTVSSIVFTYSKRDAVREFGEEKVGAAEAALQTAVNSRTVDADQIRAQLSASMDPVGDVVRWHQRQATLQRVGADPDAWLQSELERRLADPAEAAKILERIQQGAAANANRPGQTPATKLPPVLKNLQGGGNATVEPDMSDAGLFAFATARRQ